MIQMILLQLLLNFLWLILSFRQKKMEKLILVILLLIVFILAVSLLGQTSKSEIF
jgi:tryptophan-rich sensory protein